MASDTKSEFDPSQIEYRSVRDLAKSIERCKGHFSFLIGAGSSKKAGIPTAGELVKEWRKESFEYNHPETNIEDVNSEEIQSWASTIESNQMSETEHVYGFWFENLYTTRGERRQFIRDLVEDAEPTFGHIVLASMMEDGYIPLTLTPNFDDLLYDAFYLFLEEKPMMIDHNAVAPQFQLTQDRPSILKLHGDYLYNNLKNTANETQELEMNMKRAVSRSLDEYGMVVTGYGGNDESIMSIMNSAEVDIPDYGLFWCKLPDSDLSEGAKNLLQKPNTFVVETDGFEELLSNLYSDIEELSIPMPNEISSRADDREQMLRDKVSESEGTDNLDLLMAAQEYSEKEEYDSAIELFSKVINSEDSDRTDLLTAYSGRSRAFLRKGDQEKGVEDCTSAIELDESHERYLNRAEAYIINNQPDEALEDIESSKEMGNKVDRGAIHFLTGLANILRGDEDYSEEDCVREIKSEDGLRHWEFKTMEKGVENMSIGGKEEKFKSLIAKVKDSHVAKSTDDE